MDNQKKINIAIDGYSSCGKSTLAKALAKALNYIFIDSGAMYRAITLHLLNKKFIKEDNIEVNQIIEELKNIELHFEFNPLTERPEIYLNNKNVELEIRTMYVSSNVSKIASIKEVRTKLVQIQQKIGENGGVVMDGRDIGSIVFPNAEVKFFITADPEIRAKRRLLELNDPKITFEEVLSNLKERDYLDSTRSESPLIQVDDAIVIDNSKLNQEQQLEIALKIVKERRKVC
jgi:CMP/dCMP kinase